MRYGSNGDGDRADQGMIAKQVSNALRALLKRGVVGKTGENGDAPAILVSGDTNAWRKG